MKITHDEKFPFLICRQFLPEAAHGSVLIKKTPNLPGTYVLRLFLGGERGGQLVATSREIDAKWDLSNRDSERRKKERRLTAYVSFPLHDLHAEQGILFQHIFPEMDSFCSDRGVGFSFINIRPGCPQDLVQSSLLVEPALRLVEDCRPHFIGCLGNRYGPIPPTLPPGLTVDGGMFPWILDNKNSCLTQGICLSLQELEVLYGFLLPVKQDRCFASSAFFTFQSPSFTVDGGSGKSGVGGSNSSNSSRSTDCDQSSQSPLYKYYQHGIGTVTSLVQDPPHYIRNLGASFKAMNDLKERVQSESPRIALAYSSAEEYKQAMLKKMKEDVLREFPTLDDCTSSLITMLQDSDIGTQENLRHKFWTRQRIAKLNSFYMDCIIPIDIDWVFSLDDVAERGNKVIIIHGKPFSGTSSFLANKVGTLYNDVKRKYHDMLKDRDHSTESFPIPSSRGDENLTGRVLSIFIDRYSSSASTSSWTIESIMRIIKFEAKCHYGFKKNCSLHLEWMVHFGLWLEARGYLLVIIIDGIDAVNGTMHAPVWLKHKCKPFPSHSI